MTRNFREERQWQLIREELDKHMPPELKAIYMQSSLLRWMWTASPKELVEHRRRFLAEQKAAGNILNDVSNAAPSADPDDSSQPD